MTELRPEPANVGPIAGGHLRASDSDREKVATVLSTAYAEGRLSREEHDERLDQVMQARTFDDLVPVTQDLVPFSPPNPLPAPSPSTSNGSSIAIDPNGATAEPDRFIAIFSGAERKGKWRLRKTNQALTVFGGVDLDMREAVFEDQQIEISAVCLFGGIDLKVPSGVEVRDHTFGVFGGSEVRDVGDHQPGAPTIVLKGMSMFGGISVRGPKPPKKRRGC